MKLLHSTCSLSNLPSLENSHIANQLLKEFSEAALMPSQETRVKRKRQTERLSKYTLTGTGTYRSAIKTIFSLTVTRTRRDSEQEDEIQERKAVER